MSESSRRLVIVMLLLVLAIVNVVATHDLLTTRYPGANDFYSRWAGARAFWTQGLSPYSEEASIQIETGIYGRRARSDEDPGPFVYPFYTVFLIAPLAFMPYEWAAALWLTILQFALVAGALGSMRLAGWRPKTAWLAGVIVWAVLFYPSARAIILGQFAVVVFVFAVMALLALRGRRDLLAGACLALATIKPQMVFLFVPFVLLWAAARRRWRVLIGAVGAAIVLAGASFILEPTWLSDFVRQVSRYPSYTAVGSPVWIVTRYYLPALGQPAEIILSLALLAWALAAWPRALRRPDWPIFLGAVSVTLVATHLIAVRTATTNYVILFIPIMQILATLERRWPRRGPWLVAGVELIWLLGLWILFAVTLEGRFEHPINFLPLPIALALTWAGWRKTIEAGLPA